MTTYTAIGRETALLPDKTVHILKNEFAERAQELIHVINGDMTHDQMRQEPVNKEIYDLKNENNILIDRALALMGYFLDEYKNRPHTQYIVAEHGYALDELVKSNEWNARNAVACISTDDNILSQLKDDESVPVRMTLAGHGFFHDIYVHDSDIRVRCEVAEATDDSNIINILMTEDDDAINEIIASRGLRLSVLKDNKSASVRACVGNITDDMNILEQLSNDDDPLVRGSVADRGFFADKFVNDDKEYEDRSELVLRGVASTTTDMNVIATLKDKLGTRVRDFEDEFAFNPVLCDSYAGDDRSYILDYVATVTQDENILERFAHMSGEEYWMVRETVARRGFFHDVLVHDPVLDVRHGVADSTQDPTILQILVQDDNMDMCLFAYRKLLNLATTASQEQ